MTAGASAMRARILLAFLPWLCAGHCLAHETGDERGFQSQLLGVGDVLPRAAAARLDS